ncbi:ATP-binding protein [Streptomyces sp. I05A-00742]|uniref:ATP-binding protein n=1 Tax=Streptomyces sp. I05A-00742 TaxID=2732853 RepID=UPI00148815FD|nr:ATP-binding protein [Streptomyces sp. I05A-00742]
MLPRPAVPDVAPFSYTLNIPHDPRAVRVARASIRSALMTHELPELAGVSELLASEMLTNAILHSYGETELHLRWAWQTLRMTVWDSNPKPPDLRPYDLYGESGRGLRLLRLLSDRWGFITRDREGWGRTAAKAVWCEIGRQVGSARI